MSPSATSLARLLRALDLERLGENVFRARTGTGEERMYGGLTVTQAMVAAARTVSGGDLHSLHAYFLRPGRHGAPIEFRVEKLRDGRNLSTRNVIGVQSGRAIVAMLASFVRLQDGISHQEPMPAAPPPDGLPEWDDLKAAALDNPSLRHRDLAMDVRVCDPHGLTVTTDPPARWLVWIRPRGTLPDDPLLHTAFLVFVTDRTLLRAGARPHGSVWRVREAASVDHAVWLHRPVRFDDWMLYVCQSPAAHAGRSLGLGALYGRDGTRVASVAQEGLVKF